MMQRRPPSGAQAVDKGSLAYLQSRNKNRRMNLLFVLGLTVVNIVLLFADSSSYFLFSALLPYWTVAFGYYWEVPVLMAVGIGILLVYLVLFLLWDRHPAVPIAALVLFSLDCAFLVWLCIGEPISDYLLDILFHVALLVYLIDSVRVAVALRRKQKAARGNSFGTGAVTGSSARQICRLHSGYAGGRRRFLILYFCIDKPRGRWYDLR